MHGIPFLRRRAALRRALGTTLPPYGTRPWSLHL